MVAVISIGLTSVVAAQNPSSQYGAKGVPEMLYLSDDTQDNLYLVTDDSRTGAETLDNVSLTEFDNQSFQGCVYYTQFDPRVWDTAGPLDIDCYDSQEFQSLIDQGYFTDLELRMVNRGINK
jgi:hypothetical protein